MLRNSSKNSICGLIIVVLLTGCSSVTPIFLDGSGTSGVNKLSHIKIKADPYYEYVIASNLSNVLSSYSKDLSKYKVNIKVEKDSGAAAYSEKEVLKEQIRLIAHIEILDENYRDLLSKRVDSFSSHEVKDDTPFSSLSSESETINLILSDLSNSISTIILAFLHSRI